MCIFGDILISGERREYLALKLCEFNVSSAVGIRICVIVPSPTTLDKRICWFFYCLRKYFFVFHPFRFAIDYMLHG